MKKILTLILIACFALPSIAQVSEEKNVLKVNTLSFLLGTGSIFYERELSDLTSAQLGVGYMNFKLGDTKFTGLILTPEFKIYLKKNAIDGFYAAPYLRYQRFTAEVTDDFPSKGTLTSMGGGLVFGRQWITNSGFTMDLFFGGHYGKADVNVDSGDENGDYDTTFFEGFRMRIGFSLGFAF
ncbi:MAG: DUF3575 domain-containing protein [Bacteroidales bacterium]|nr:MAG: DUF3575 domain-containing protein [Bacteroidales bacterium]